MGPGTDPFGPRAAGVAVGLVAVRAVGVRAVGVAVVVLAAAVPGTAQQATDEPRGPQPSQAQTSALTTDPTTAPKSAPATRPSTAPSPTTPAATAAATAPATTAPATRPREADVRDVKAAATRFLTALTRGQVSDADTDFDAPAASMQDVRRIASMYASSRALFAEAAGRFADQADRLEEMRAFLSAAPDLDRLPPGSVSIDGDQARLRLDARDELRLRRITDKSPDVAGRDVKSTISGPARAATTRTATTRGAATRGAPTGAGAIDTPAIDVATPGTGPTSAASNLNSGEANTADATTGEVTTGDTSTGEVTTGEVTTGDTPQRAATRSDAGPAGVDSSNSDAPASAPTPGRWVVTDLLPTDPARRTARLAQADAVRQMLDTLRSELAAGRFDTYADFRDEFLRRLRNVRLAQSANE